MALAKPKKYQCDICQIGFSRAYDKKRHDLMKHPGSYNPVKRSNTSIDRYNSQRHITEEDDRSADEDHTDNESSEESVVDISKSDEDDSASETNEETSKNHSKDVCDDSEDTSESESDDESDDERPYNQHDMVIGRYAVRSEKYMEAIHWLLDMYFHYKNSMLHKVLENAKEHFQYLYKMQDEEVIQKALELREGFIENLIKFCNGEEIEYDPTNSEDDSDSESELPPKEDSDSDSDEEKEEDFNYHDEMIGKYVIQEYGEAHMEGINKILLVISHFRKSSVYKVIKNAKSHFCTLSKFKRSEANKRAIELRSGYIENLFKMCQSEEEDPEI